MSASKNRQMDCKGPQIEKFEGEFTLKLGQVEPNLTKRKTIGRGARLIVGFSEHPYPEQRRVSSNVDL